MRCACRHGWNGSIRLRQSRDILMLYDMMSVQFMQAAWDCARQWHPRVRFVRNNFHDTDAGPIHIIAFLRLHRFIVNFKFAISNPFINNSHRKCPPQVTPIRNNRNKVHPIRKVDRKSRFNHPARKSRARKVRKLVSEMVGHRTAFEVCLNHSA